MNIQIVNEDHELAQCMHLRRVVFIEEQEVPEELEIDGDDDACFHVLAKIDTTPVGAARFRYLEDKAKVQRVCVPAEQRGKGIGLEIMKFIINQAREDKEVSFVSLSSQTHAIKFYEKLGFATYGDEYIDAGIRHFDMTLKL